jgi:hypothetical protein
MVCGRRVMRLMAGYDIHISAVVDEVALGEKKR